MLPYVAQHAVEHHGWLRYSANPQHELSFSEASTPPLVRAEGGNGNAIVYQGACIAMHSTQAAENCWNLQNTPWHSTRRKAA